jgi:hypothetical protein
MKDEKCRLRPGFLCSLQRSRPELVLLLPLLLLCSTEVGLRKVQIPLQQGIPVAVENSAPKRALAETVQRRPFRQLTRMCHIELYKNN